MQPKTMVPISLALQLDGSRLSYFKLDADFAVALIGVTRLGVGS